jgi:hypothetical protein
MTKFNKEDFTYHGGYLMYTGYYKDRPLYENKKGVHPSRVGTPIALFVARFKYRGTPITKANFMKELIKNHTVESYAEAIKDGTPVGILANANPAWQDTLIAKWKARQLA